MAEKLIELEKELKECLARQDHLDALDIYEELREEGLMKAKHWLGMGQCLAKLRRKQDAKKAWLKGYKLDNDYEPILKALNETFAGWKKGLESPKAQGALTPGGSAAPAPPMAPVQAAPRPTAPRPAPPQAVEVADNEINWDYVMADLAEAKMQGDVAAPSVAASTETASNGDMEYQIKI